MFKAFDEYDRVDVMVDSADKFDHGIMLVDWTDEELEDFQTALDAELKRSRSPVTISKVYKGITTTSKSKKSPKEPAGVIQETVAEEAEEKGNLILLKRVDSLSDSDQIQPKSESVSQHRNQC